MLTFTNYKIYLLDGACYLCTTYSTIYWKSHAAAKALPKFDKVATSALVLQSNLDKEVCEETANFVNCFKSGLWTPVLFI